MHRRPQRRDNVPVAADPGSRVYCPVLDIQGDRMNSFSLLTSALLAALLLAVPAWSSTDGSDDDLEWPDDNWGVEHVNEGELAFLAAPPEKMVHHHRNILTLGRGSLVDGWVQLEQCHSNIDKVGRAQILFRSGRIRALRITASENIGRAWVEDASIQLKDIGKDSRLCLSAETRALSASAGGAYRIDNGPFMRRFLDGYYAMRVSQTIVLADSGLVFSAIAPIAQPGFAVTVTDQSIDFDAWFEGRLKTSVELVQAD
jgi:hypothetical protein